MRKFIERRLTWIIATTGIVTLALFILMHEFHWESMSIPLEFLFVTKFDETFKVITAIATVCAAVAAYKAMEQALMIGKRQTFDLLFKQLLDCLLQAVSNPVLAQNTYFLFEGDKTKQQRPVATVTCFCNVFINHAEQKEMPMSLPEIKKLAADFINNLYYRSDYYKCFKSLFAIINLVNSSNVIDENTKRQYINIVQSNLSIDFLFCYFINQQTYYDGRSNNDFVKTLIKYEFFKNLFDDGRYKLFMERYFPLALIKDFR